MPEETIFGQTREMPLLAWPIKHDSESQRVSVSVRLRRRRLLLAAALFGSLDGGAAAALHNC